jgi:polyphenol oxidase
LTVASPAPGTSGGVRWSGEPPTHLAYPDFEAAGVRHAFTTRHHGSLAGPAAPGGPFGAQPQSPALAALGVRADAVRFTRQVHGTTVLVLRDRAGGLAGTADAMIATEPGQPLAILTADCLALLVADPSVPVLAAAHAGWRGTVNGLAGRLVEALAALGARPERLQAAIGPSIGPCCYEVDEPVVRPLRAAFPEAADAWLQPAGPGKWWLDLWTANADQLLRAGLRPEAIRNARLCTGCRRDLFFSYRKEGRGARLAAVAVLV